MFQQGRQVKMQGFPETTFGRFAGFSGEGIVVMNHLGGKRLALPLRRCGNFMT